MIFTAWVGFALGRSQAIAMCGLIARLLYHVRRRCGVVVRDRAALLDKLNEGSDLANILGF
jgi:hypothetical protein